MSNDQDDAIYGTGEWLSQASACAVNHLDGLTTTQDEYGKAMECLGFIAGMMDTIGFVKGITEDHLPEEKKVLFRVFTNQLTFEEIARLVHFYLVSHPEKASLTRIEVIGETLLEKFKSQKA